jgi:hypothetical protein
MSGHSGRGKKEVQSGIVAWEFPGLVRAKVGIPLSYLKGWFPSKWTWLKACWQDGEDVTIVLGIILNSRELSRELDR